MAKKLNKREPKKRGRPSKIDTINLDVLRMLCEKGLTDEELAQVFGVCKVTINEYKKLPEFMNSLKTGKELADKLVEESLFHRATGYRTKYMKNFVVSDGKMGSHIETAEEEIVFAPDTTACIFWLKNRKPKQWRDRQDIDLSGSVNIISKIPRPNK